MLLPSACPVPALSSSEVSHLCTCGDDCNYYEGIRKPTAAAAGGFVKAPMTKGQAQPKIYTVLEKE